MSGGTIQIADNGDEWPFVMSRVPYRPADEQDWRAGILRGLIASGANQPGVVPFHEKGHSA